MKPRRLLPSLAALALAVAVCLLAPLQSQGVDALRVMRRGGGGAPASYGQFGAVGGNTNTKNPDLDGDGVPDTDLPPLPDFPSLPDPHHARGGAAVPVEGEEEEAAGANVRELHATRGRGSGVRKHRRPSPHRRPPRAAGAGRHAGRSLSAILSGLTGTPDDEGEGEEQLPEAAEAEQDESEAEEGEGEGEESVDGDDFGAGVRGVPRRMARLARRGGAPVRTDYSNYVPLQAPGGGAGGAGYPQAPQQQVGGAAGPVFAGALTPEQYQQQLMYLGQQQQMQQQQQQQQQQHPFGFATNAAPAFDPSRMPPPNPQFSGGIGIGGSAVYNPYQQQQQQQLGGAPKPLAFPSPPPLPPSSPIFDKRYTQSVLDGAGSDSFVLGADGGVSALRDPAVAAALSQPHAGGAGGGMGDIGGGGGGGGFRFATIPTPQSLPSAATTSPFSADLTLPWSSTPKPPAATKSKGNGGKAAASNNNNNKATAAKAPAAKPAAQQHAPNPPPKFSSPPPRPPGGARKLTAPPRARAPGAPAAPPMRPPPS